MYEHSNMRGTCLELHLCDHLLIGLSCYIFPPMTQAKGKMVCAYSLQDKSNNNNSVGTHSDRCVCLWFAGSCHQDNCMFVPLLDSQASSSSGGDRHVAINRTISHSVSWSSSLANSLHSGVTPLSGEFANDKYRRVSPVVHLSDSVIEIISEAVDHRRLRALSTWCTQQVNSPTMIGYVYSVYACCELFEQLHQQIFDCRASALPSVLT